MGIIKTILTLPFKILFFPFRILRDMFSSREKRRYYYMKDDIKGTISKASDALGRSDLSEEDRKELTERLESAKHSLHHLKRWHRKSRSLEHDPDDRGKFMRTKRSEWKLRKTAGKFRE